MKCNLCNKETQFLEKHHIIPKSRGGKDTMPNLIEICSNCHGLAHDVSFVNNRGGLIKEGIVKTKSKAEVARKWLVENEYLVNIKMDQLLGKAPDKHALLLTLLDLEGFKAEQIKEWYETGKTKFKTTITFNSN